MDLIFYLTLVGFILIFGCVHSEIDFDFWARLIVGKSYIQTNQLFNYDFQSYGTTHNFIDHEWGSGVVFYLIQNYFNDIGIFIFKSLIIFLTVFLITKIIRLEDSKIKFHFLFFFFTLHTIIDHIFSTIRCQSFSFLFFILFLYILKYAKKTKNYRVLWTLPVLNVIWANLHGGFAVGLILIFLFMVGEFLNKEKIKPYVIAFILSCFSSLINPYGIKYIVFMIKALLLNRIHIIEWKSAIFYKYLYLFFIKFKIFLILTFGMFLFSIIKNIKLQGIKKFYEKIDKTKYLIILFTFLIALKSLRFHIFFVYSVMALCYCDFYKIFNKKLPEIIDNFKEIIIFILILVSCISHLYDYKFINVVTNNNYPIYCVEFIKQNNLKGNLFSIFHTGSYVSYKLYPNVQIFMDGRYEEVYDVDLINQMSSVFIQGNDELFKRYHTDMIIFDKNYSSYENFKKNPNWFIAFEDNKYVLFLSKASFKNKKFILPEKDKNYYNKTKFETNINWLTYN